MLEQAKLLQDRMREVLDFASVRSNLVDKDRVIRHMKATVIRPPCQLLAPLPLHEDQSQRRNAPSGVSSTGADVYFVDGWGRRHWPTVELNSQGPTRCQAWLGLRRPWSTFWANMELDAMAVSRCEHSAKKLSCIQLYFLPISVWPNADISA